MSVTSYFSHDLSSINEFFSSLVSWNRIHKSKTYYLHYAIYFCRSSINYLSVHIIHMHVYIYVLWLSSGVVAFLFASAPSSFTCSLFSTVIFKFPCHVIKFKRPILFPIAFIDLVESDVGRQSKERRRTCAHVQSINDFRIICASGACTCVVNAASGRSQWTTTRLLTFVSTGTPASAVVAVAITTIGAWRVELVASCAVSG